MTRADLYNVLLDRIHDRYGLCVALSVDEASPLVRVSDSKIYELQRQARFPVAYADARQVVPIPGLFEWLEAGGSRTQPDAYAPIPALPRGALALGGSSSKLPSWLEG